MSGKRFHTPAHLGESPLPLWAVQVIVFLSFFPYPAVVALGRSVGVQAVQIVVVFVCCTQLQSVVRTASMKAFLLLVLPQLASLSILVVTAEVGDPTLAIRSYASTVFVLTCLPGFGLLLLGRDLGQLVLPVSAAIFVNLAAAAYQFTEFRSGRFPMIEYFSNPSFADIQAISGYYASYTHRPIGIFPEPSSMAAAIGPWGVLLLLYGSQGQKPLRHLALGGSFACLLAIALGSTVYFPFLLLAYLAAILSAGVRPALRFAVVALGASLVWWGFSVGLLGRLDLGSNRSFQYRLESLVAAKTLAAQTVSALFVGRGPGQTSLALAENRLGVESVYSILGTWWVEGGMMALAGVIVVAAMAVRRLPTIGTRIAFACWIVGVGSATGYTALLPVWLLLAFVLDGATWERVPNAVLVGTIRLRGPHDLRVATLGRVGDPLNAGSAARGGADQHG